MRSFESGNAKDMEDDETITFQYGTIDMTLNRFNLQISPLGISQVLKGQVVTSSKDRETLARFLKLVAGSGASVLIGLLLPAVQKMRV